MRSKLVTVLLVSSLGFLVHCDKDEVTARNFPRLKTLPVSEITPNGARFNAEIIFRGDFEVLNYGFVWSENENPTIENSDRVIFAENILSDNFSEIIETTLREDVSYFVRAFIETNNFIVYGENVGFVSLGSAGPELMDFLPKSGHVEDTLRLKANNFGRIKSNVEVNIDQIAAEIVGFEETELSVLVPNLLSSEKSTISVSVSGNTTSFEDKFTLLKPVINTINPTSITFGSSVVIEGMNFDTRPNKITVSFIGADGTVFPAEVISVTESRIETIVPTNIASKQSEISISMNNFEIIGNQIINIQNPLVSRVFPLSGKTLSEITIVGENFSPVASNNIVRIDEYPAEIVIAANNKLIVKVPAQSNHIYSGRQVQISVEVLSTKMTVNDQFNITDRWFRLNNLPFTSYTWKGLSINGEGYVLFPGGNWKYNPVNGNWTKLTAFPDATRSGPGIFTTAGKIFLGAGGNSTNRNNNDFWEYDITTDVWTQKSNFPGQPRKGPLAFSIGENGYMGVGLKSTFSSCCSGFSDVWKYNPSNETWTQVSNHPAAEFRGMWRTVSTELNNEVYAGLGTTGTQGATNNEIYKYNGPNDQWIKVNDYPHHAQYGHIDGVAFTVNNQVFFGSGEYQDELFSFDGASWFARESKSRAGRNGGFSFVIDNIAYLGGGATASQFWLFDFSQPD